MSTIIDAVRANGVDEAAFRVVAKRGAIKGVLGDGRQEARHQLCERRGGALLGQREGTKGNGHLRGTHAGTIGQQAPGTCVVGRLREAGVDWVCLAGYMRLLSAAFVEAYPYRILNIHPALLPAFPGLHGQRQAWKHGVKVSGCTVHLVDLELDHGPIVIQRSVPVYFDDNEERLSARILEQEHIAYPEALKVLLTQPWSLDGRRVVYGRILHGADIK